MCVGFLGSAMSRIESNKDAAIKNQLTREEDLKRKQALLEEQGEGHDKEYRDKASALDAKDEVLADLRDKQGGGLNETIAVLESDDALEETINKLEQELSDLLRQQAIAKKRLRARGTQYSK